MKRQIMPDKSPQSEYDALMKRLYQEYGQDRIAQFREYVSLASSKETEEIRVFTSNNTSNGN
jgi:hypothetical protein